MYHMIEAMENLSTPNVKELESFQNVTTVSM